VIPKDGGFGSAEITRLTAASAGGASPLESKFGITLGGQYFDDNANLSGSKSVETVKSTSAGGKLSYAINMPAASAALIKIQRNY
jgi:hypothetical protein